MTTTENQPQTQPQTQTRNLTLLKDGDAGYDEARSVWNAMVDRRPAVIAKCRSTTEVATAVRYAREHGLEIGVRCGGQASPATPYPTAA
ncbi:hypothetical protein GCM10009789_53490 [Kribbella sancticallisti]|uniref:Uncharacterized protein n=1 Tax=Kribbella sancticallisti TaxID=460087 RepID=A0ABN2E2F7_9ACTN